MRPELFEIPERRNTLTRELLDFFREHTGDRWLSSFEMFLRTFSGTEFIVPGPEFLRDLARDEEVLARLEASTSVDIRVEVLVDFGISYRYLENLWRVCKGENLLPPGHGGGRVFVIEAAAKLMGEHKGIETDIAAMFGLTAAERAKALASLNHRPKQDTLTAPQRRLVKFIFRNSGVVQKSLIKARYHSMPLKVISQLSSMQMLRVSENGNKLALTTKGRRAAE